jgi:hypothetical protein
LCCIVFCCVYYVLYCIFVLHCVCCRIVFYCVVLCCVLLCCVYYVILYLFCCVVLHCIVLCCIYSMCSIHFLHWRNSILLAKWRKPWTRQSKST